MTTPAPAPQSPVYDDEIDLFELAQDLWREKVVVLVVGTVVTLCALAYALLAKPVYEASASLVPPLHQAVQPYNKGRVGIYDESLKIEQLTVERVYGAFKTNLGSTRLQTEFFEQVYLPSLTAEQQAKPRDNLLKSFRQNFAVKKGDAKTNPELFIVSVSHADGTVAAEWVQIYIDMAVQRTKKQLKERVYTERDLLVTSLQARIDSMLEVAAAERKEQVARLKEALYVAEAIGLEDPSSQSDKASFGANRFIDNDLIYTRGAKTLRAQLTVLENRKEDVAFIEDFSKAREQLDLLTRYQLDDTLAEVAVIDREAEIPASPVKPKKTLIVAIGLVLGGMLGIFAALLRSAIRKRKKSQQAIA